MLENRKLFYAISVLLLSYCRIITMFPHNDGGPAASSARLLDNGASGQARAGGSISDSSNNSEYNRANVDSSSRQSYGARDEDASEFIIAVHRNRQTMEPSPAPTGNVGVWASPPDGMASENVDDLIFLDKRPINHHQQQQQQQQLQRSYIAQLPGQANEQGRQRHHHFEIHHHLSADGQDSGSSSSESQESSSSASASSSSSSSSSTHSLPQTTLTATTSPSDEDDAAHDQLSVQEPDVAAARPPHGIDLQPSNNEEDSTAIVTVVSPLDLSDFLALIPADRVKAIVANYYNNDPEVQRAHAFMASADFMALKHHIIAIPEMAAFLRYLNASGLDLVKLAASVTNITMLPKDMPLQRGEGGEIAMPGIVTQQSNDIEYAGSPHSANGIATATVPANVEANGEPSSSESSTSMAMASGMQERGGDEETTSTTAKQELNGLHGLVDSVLDVLPQDQILATFFDKLESSAQFSKLVDNIGSPEFAKILNNMQHSIPLRNLIFTLHNNGIYVIRIVDSLKSYFFLGGF